MKALGLSDRRRSRRGTSPATGPAWRGSAGRRMGFQLDGPLGVAADRLRSPFEELDRKIEPPAKGPAPHHLDQWDPPDEDRDRPIDQPKRESHADAAVVADGPWEIDMDRPDVSRDALPLLAYLNHLDLPASSMFNNMTVINQRRPGE